jgi:deoxyribose-phosphate aldolase
MAPEIERNLEERHSPMPVELDHSLEQRIHSIREDIRRQNDRQSRPLRENQGILPDLDRPVSSQQQIPGSTLTLGELSRYIEHTLLKAEATPLQIQELCWQAVQYQFATACVNPRFASLAARSVSGSSVNICCVVGFPLGATSLPAKAFEAERAIQDGATEIDMVLPIGFLLEKEYREVFSDILGVVEVCHDHGSLLKVIVETSELNEEQIIAACLLSKDAGADYVKTSTGFGTGGATKEDVALMRAVVGDEMGVKASGGIRNLSDALEMIQSGANRLGTSSGVHIMQQALGDRVEHEVVLDY